MSIFPKRFVGTHAHTGFSSFDGLGLPKEHFDFVIENSREELEIPAMAITEHGHMNSFAHAYLYAKELNKAGKRFKFIPGVEAYLHPDLNLWRQQKTAAEDAAEDQQHGGTVENEDETKSIKSYDPIKRRHHLVVLAKSSAALQKLFSLVSRGYIEGFYKFPRIDYSMLKPFKGEFVVQTACIGGPLAYSIFSAFPNVPFDDLKPSLVDDPGVRASILARLENDLDQMIDAVGREDLFLELQFNRLEAQHLTNRMLIELSKKTGVRLTATADSHYYRPSVWREREIYKKLGWLNYSDISPDDLPKSVDDMKAELYPKNAAQMWAEYGKAAAKHGFYDDATVAAAIEMSYDIAFNVIGDVQPDVSVKLPSWSVPQGKTAIEALKELCDAGMVKMGFDKDDVYNKRLAYELQIIDEKKFSEYFLTMKGIIDIAAEHMLVGCGRGSAAGSLVNYVLGITQVDPIKFNLIFERFINRNRIEYPDIDSDFANRDLLIKLLKDRFGDLNVIPISNYNGFQLKSLIKDVSRFFHQVDGDGLDFQSVNAVLGPLDDEVRKKVLKQGDDKNLFELKLEHCMGDDLPDDVVPGPAMIKFKEFMETHPDVYGPIKTLLHENKSLGKHAGGVLVTENIVDRMPVILSKKEPQTPFVEGMHYKHLNELGWIKFDLLGLETLRIIERSIELILQRHHDIVKPTFAQIKDWYEKNIHPDVINMDDASVYECYEKGKFAGLFQFTAKGAQMFIQRVKPKNIIDVATATSIYRPGPLTAKVDDIYIDAKEDPDSVKYEHPLVKQVLEKTYGCIIFQEQLMELGHVVGGLSLEECDKLRKVITKRSVSGASKAKEDALKLEKKFIEGAVEKGVDEKVAKDLFEKMAYFSGYGFNASLLSSQGIQKYTKDGMMLGEHPIENFGAGDFVKTRDERLGKDVITEVVALHDHDTIELFEFELDDGRRVTCSMDHKFRVMDGRMLPMRQIVEEDLDIVVDIVESNSNDDRKS